MKTLIHRKRSPFPQRGKAKINNKLFPREEGKVNNKLFPREEGGRKTYERFLRRGKEMARFGCAQQPYACQGILGAAYALAIVLQRTARKQISTGKAGGFLF